MRRRAVEALHGLLDLGVGDRQRRQEAHDVIYDVAQAVARGELDGGFESGLMKDDKVRGTLDGFGETVADWSSTH